MTEKVSNLNFLAETEQLLATDTPFPEILAAMVDRVIEFTDADRGMLLETYSPEEVRARFARDRNGFLTPDAISPDEDVIEKARSTETEVIVESASGSNRPAVMALPLLSGTDPELLDSYSDLEGATLLGVLYLDSQKPDAFEKLTASAREALGNEAARVVSAVWRTQQERGQRELARAVQIARQIQRRLLPESLSNYGFLEASGVNEPCRPIGGDHFDLVEMEPGRLAFIIADVTGKGLAAALLASMIQGGFFGITLTSDPASHVGRFNDYVWKRSDPQHYATALIGVIDRSGNAEVINAGHRSALLVRGDTIESPFDSGSFPIGLFGESDFSPSSVKLERGDYLVMFTDGIEEAENREGEPFGMDRLSEVVSANRGRSPEAMQRSILDAVAAFSLGTLQEDDITLLIMRYTGEV